MTVIAFGSYRRHEDGILFRLTAPGQFAAFLHQQDVVALDIVLRVLVPHAADYAQRGAVPATEQVTGHDVFGDRVILDRRIEGRVHRIELERIAIGVEVVAGPAEVRHRRDIGQAIILFAQHVSQGESVVLPVLGLHVV